MSWEQKSRGVLPAERGIAGGDYHQGIENIQQKMYLLTFVRNAIIFLTNGGDYAASCRAHLEPFEITARRCFDQRQRVAASWQPGRDRSGFKAASRAQ